jgi:hypothetical protein
LEEIIGGGDMDVVTLAVAKAYSNKVGSTIQGTSYDYNTGELTFNTTDGDWVVPVNSGMTPTYKNTLDNVVYNATEDKLEVNGVEILTKDDVEDEDIDFGGMFP